MGRIQQALERLNQDKPAPRQPAPAPAAPLEPAELPWPAGRPSAHCGSRIEESPAQRPIRPVFEDGEPAHTATAAEPTSLSALPQRSGHGESNLVDAMLAKLTPGVPLTLALGTAGHREHADAVVAHIAISLAARQLGKVLAVDAQLGRETLPDLLGARRARGLADVLAGHVPWEAVLETTRHELLRWMGPGRVAHEELLPPTETISDLLGQLKRHFRFVLLHAGSLGEPAAQRMAAACDGVYVVVDPLEADHRAVDRALVELQSAGSLVLGCIALGDETRS